MSSLLLLPVVGVAVTGWIATVIVISRSSLERRSRRWVIMLAWVPWIALALGAPTLRGALTPDSALSVGAAITAGLLVPLILSSGTPRLK